MSLRGAVQDMRTGTVVAADGRLTGEHDTRALVGCTECARAIALGWWGGIARHRGDREAPVCVLCSEGEATLDAGAWFVLVASLAARNTVSGRHRTWREDAVRGLGAAAAQPQGD
jgi:hypothetical protein